MELYNEKNWDAFFLALADHPKRERFTADDVVELARRCNIIRSKGVRAGAGVSGKLVQFRNQQTSWGFLSAERRLVYRNGSSTLLWFYSFTPSPNLARAAAMPAYQIDPITPDEVTAAFEPEQTAQSANETAMIPFHGSALRVAKDGEQVYVAIRPICEHLGIAANGQLERLRRDEDFELVSYLINSTDGKNYEMACLPQEQLLGWLYTISSNRVSAQSREMLKKYRRETTQAINDYWTKGHAVRGEQAAITASTSSIDFGAFDRILGLESAVQRVVDTVPRVIDAKVDEVKQEIRSEFNTQIQSIQQEMDEERSKRPMSGEQLGAIYNLVHTLVPLLYKTPTKHDYRFEWSLLNRRYGFSSYRDIYAIHFEDARDWLIMRIKNAGGAPSLFDESAD